MTISKLMSVVRFLPAAMLPCDLVFHEICQTERSGFALTPDEVHSSVVRLQARGII